MLMGSDAWSIAATWRLLYFGMLAIGMILPLLLLSQVHAGIGVRAVAGVIGGGNQPMFTSSFLVRFRQGVDNEFAHEVAAKYGFDNLGPVSKPPSPSHCLLRQPSSSVTQSVRQDNSSIHPFVHSSFLVKNLLFYGPTAWAGLEPKDAVEKGLLFFANCDCLSGCMAA